ncbi:hypothetical protein [Nitrosomonas communis]|uniref:Uncharacterized protein n=1 Tax=Nitrosomonas communis TaxID=44574 RepID=A0A1H2V3N6_9PROT|nr:hypothetical protein [Nitrosomonas communis]SDW62905.1 hypothetical protein SAMN05421882_101939 [Nitrosomonas communis]
MSAEFYITFKTPTWLVSNLSRVEEKISSLKTFIARNNNQFWLLGTENRDQEGRWKYDVRLIFEDNTRILLEISIHPESIEMDLSLFLQWLREQTDISVIDEDGELSGW